MILFGLIFIIFSFIIIGQFVLVPIMIFLGIIKNSSDETQKNKANEKLSSSMGERSLKLLNSELERVAGPNTIRYKKGTYIVNLRYPNDHNISAAKRQFRIRNINNFKIK